MLFDKLIGLKPGAGDPAAAGTALTASGSKYLLERIVKWVLFILATVSILTTVGIVSVLLFEGVQFFASDFYQEKHSELEVTSEAQGLTGSDSAPTTLAPGIIPRVHVRATTDSVIHVSWDKPTAGAPPTDYQVSILPSLNTNLSDCQNPGPERTSCIIADASAGRSYKVTVAGWS